jgi:hypothetical protein
MLLTPIAQSSSTPTLDQVLNEGSTSSHAATIGSLTVSGSITNTALSTALAAALQLSGGTLTGNLTAPTITLAGDSHHLFFQGGYLKYSGGLAILSLATDNGIISSDGNGNLTIGNGSLGGLTINADAGLTVNDGTTSLDDGAFATDGAGNVTLASLAAGGSVFNFDSAGAVGVAGRLVVDGMTSLDNGLIYTDGVGDITLTSSAYQLGLTVNGISNADNPSTTWTDGSNFGISVNGSTRGAISLDDSLGRINFVNFTSFASVYLDDATGDVGIGPYYGSPVIVDSSGKLLVAGTTSLDNGAINTDGGGNVGLNNLNAAQVQIGMLYVSGSSTLDNGAINTDGGGNVGLNNLNAAQVQIGTLYVSGSSSLDNGEITTDGNGNVGLNNLNAAQVQIGTLYVSGSSSLDNGEITTDGNGDLTLQSAIFNPQSAPASPTEGQIYYDNGTNTLKLYNGSTWKTITAA